MQLLVGLEAGALQDGGQVVALRGSVGHHQRAQAVSPQVLRFTCLLADQAVAPPLFASMATMLGAVRLSGSHLVGFVEGGKHSSASLWLSFPLRRW